MNIFLPYNQKYILNTYGFDTEHASFIEEIVIQNLLKRLTKNKLISRVDIYTQDNKFITRTNSKKLNFIKSPSNEFDTSEKIIQDYLSIQKLTEPFVYYNLMFPFTMISKIYNALQTVNQGIYESATGVIDKGVLWSRVSSKDTNPSGHTLSQKEIDTVLDVGSFCIIKPENILKGLRRTTQPILLVPLASHELINMRSKSDKDLYQLLITSGMDL